MLMNIKLTDKQALRIARRIYRGLFRTYGLGNFDLKDYEFAAILKVVFNSTTNIDADVKLYELYEDLLDEKGL